MSFCVIGKKLKTYLELLRFEEWTLPQAAGYDFILFPSSFPGQCDNMYKKP